jgi:hypothetical protein
LAAVSDHQDQSNSTPEQDAFGTLDFDFDEGHGMRRTIHYIVLDTRRAMIRLTSDESGLRDLGSVVQAQCGVG